MLIYLFIYEVQGGRKKERVSVCERDRSQREASGTCVCILVEEGGREGGRETERGECVCEERVRSRERGKRECE